MPEKITPENPTAAILDSFEQLEKKLGEFSQMIGRFCPGEISDLGIMLNSLDEIIDLSKEIEPHTFHQISIACKGYVEKMTLENLDNTGPIEEGLVLLKSILNHLKRGEPFTFDYSDILDLLEDNSTGEQKTKGIELEEAPAIKIQPGPEKISDDDMEILMDFVSEALENLDTIEVNLIDLEQDPSNMEIINDIFRPFHTIKGVSGFLSLTKINKLAHATENLLDSARSGEFLINARATDVILESVDTLKTLIARINQGTDKGFMQPDDDIDVNDLRDKLQTLQVSLTKGNKEPLGSILVKKRMVDQNALDQALDTQKNQPGKKIGEILVEGKKVQANQVASALIEQNQPRKKVDAQVKVSTQKLDDLVDYAGELVIAQSMLKQKTINDPSLSQNVSQLGQIVTNMQNIAMSMRMIPIKATFMKMIRLVRDLAKKSGKEVNLNMAGEDTEIDRNVVDALYEPMVHMIRNSCDHGIESASDRLEKGKPSQGEIILRAYHRGGHILIEIEDDGKGLDKKTILEKAKETGLITGNEQLTDAQVYDLILQPGFSTAKTITDVSGRGVGMDVVKSGIEKFRGQLNIASEKGRGTKFTISLPLTLAIIDGMLVRVDEEKYVIPTIAIQKAFKPGKEDYFTIKGKGEMVKDRGSLIPMIRLNEIYDSSKHKKSVQDGLVVVVESKDEKRALFIDELLGKDEYVIKSLGSNLEEVNGISGGAILADGRVGLILDIHGIFSIVSKG
ncbi:CheA1 [Desulforapulum autotrophicum HRM2]|uniref:Chemotaxis protein CheA n=1 Tax=Desulforapulum autotrophicum (strain ATCC 43914 / DSM 3382 / VKM B-1955 / HRM2) TaxID=177437 RepID=C0QMJ8_DESAH|nr:chemotaxis protein CheA [Desulforapulum autotrophicum]ACN16515.1 CheA1 [Desulforapulum autotrophicum HRM2]